MKKTLKRSLSFLLAITIIFGSMYVGLGEVDFSGLFAVEAKAASSGTCGENVTWALDNYGTLTISGTGPMADASWASSPWREYTSSVKSVVITNGVTRIGGSVFFGLSYITSVSIPNSVTSIGEDAFTGCGKITSITLPNNLQTIESWAFSECMGLTSIVIPDSVTRLGDRAFSTCKNLESVKLSENIPEIERGTFAYCEKLASVTIPESVTSIGETAFQGCTSLTAITIPSNVTTMGAIPFYNCTNLTEINISEENKAFSFDDGVLFNKDKTELIECLAAKSGTEYKIPDTVTNIAKKAFYYCTKLTSIIIPIGVTTIGERAFAYCSGLTSLTLPESVINIGAGAFGRCTGISSFKIPERVASTGSETFSGCTSLTSITIPDSITSIGYEAFYNCTSLEYIFYEGSESDWSNIVIDTNNTPLTNAVIHYNTTDHVYGDWITDVEPSCTVVGQKSRTCNVCDYKETKETATSHYYANGYCETCGVAQEFKYTVENDTVTIKGYIGSSTDVIIPSFIDGLPVTSIYSTAFFDCDSLTSVKIPGSVISIGSSAFESCDGLETVVLCDGVKTIQTDAFYGCSNLSSITLPDSVTYIGRYAFLSTKYYNTYNNYEDNLLYIGNHLIGIRSASYITSYKIKAGTKNIANNTFEFCPYVKTVTIPDSVTNIGNLAFYSCKSLTAIDIDANNESYSSVNGVLFNKDKTRLIQYPQGKTAVAYTIPDTVTNIDKYAFYGCTALVSIVTPDSITSIGNSAFYNCSNLSYVFYAGSQSDWNNMAIDICNDAFTNAEIHYNATDHTYQDVNLAPNCTEDGGKGKKCVVCGCALDYETIPATGHQTTEWITEKEPTCDVAGYKDEWCLDCGEIINTEEIPATGHLNTEWITEKEPTCDVAGYKDEWCLDCGELINSEEIPATGHSYDEWSIDVEPSCKEEGSKHHTCSVCGDVETEVISSNGHNYSEEWTIDIEPTCSEEGSKSHHCSVCGDKADVTVVEPLGHSYATEWTIDIAPTCTEAGSKSHHCTGCDEAVADVTVIEPLGHDFINASISDEHPHINTFECSRCPETNEEESYSEECGICNFIYTDNGNGTCTITGYIGSSISMFIPASIDGKIVVNTNTGAFKSNTSLTSVVLEDGVQGIGSLAFLGCSSLSKAVIPASVTSIGTKAFYNCANDFTIYCYSGSCAEQYAIDNSLNYVVMDIGETDNCTIDYENKIIYTPLNASTNLNDIVYTPTTSSVSVQASLISGDKEYLGTGSVITVVDNGVTTEYTLVVEGDVNGDSVCDALDAWQVSLASNGHETLNGAYALAADSNSDDVVDITDYQSIVNRVVA